LVVVYILNRRVGKGALRRAHHSFPERSLDIFDVPTPVRRKQSAFNITMETAVRPIGYARDVPMLHRIEMDVVDVAL
jgi:hypothetical protein